MKIKEIMAVNVTTLDPDASAEEASRLMRDAGVGFAPVVSGGMVLGVLTDRDIVVRAAAKGRHLKVVKVLDILTPGAIHCGLEDDVQDAAKLMAENRVRRIIVVKPDNTLAGVVSLVDIAAHAGETAKAVEDILRASLPRTASREGAQAPAAAAPLRGRIDSLVRRELSAVEIYKLALAKVGGTPAADELRRIEREHEEAVDLLLASLRSRGEPSPTSSGLRGAWLKAREGGALILGSKAAIRALKSGEKHGLRGYEKALEDAVLDAEIKDLIRARLLPQTREHLPALDRVLAAVS